MVGPGYITALVLLYAQLRDWLLAGATAAFGVLSLGVMRTRRGSAATSRVAVWGSHLAAALGACAAASGALAAVMALAAPIGRIYARRQRLVAARAAAG